MSQADKYYDSFFNYFEIIAESPYAFESVDYIKKGYRRCVCGSDVEIMAIIGRQDLNNIL